MLPIASASGMEAFVDFNSNGRLVYEQDELGNRIPDFSFAGYQGGGQPIPWAPAVVLVNPGEGDDTNLIQSALNHVSSLPLNSSGIRGAVQLGPGTFEVSGQLTIKASGVVLRGSGDLDTGTTIVAQGVNRRTLIEISGTGSVESGEEHSVADPYIPVGSVVLNIQNPSNFKPGDEIQIRRPSPQNWIDLMGMQSMKGRPAPIWKPGTLDVVWDRKIQSIEGTRIIIDAPLTCALDQRLGGGWVSNVTRTGRINNVGIENLRLKSTWDSSNPKDENHSWMAITLNHLEDAWVRNVSGHHFVSSVVSIWEGARRVTVMDCRSVEPVSEIGGYRRHAFHTAGQQNLFLRCLSASGIHDFSTGWKAAGPNAFVHCETQGSLNFSGPIESWSTGVLFDNLIMDGGGLRFDNREIWDNGVGWAAANCVAWQCSTPIVVNRKPPGANNWAIGCWAQFVGDGSWRSSNEFVDPESLFFQQLRERLGKDSVHSLGPLDWSNKLESQTTVPEWKGPGKPLETKSVVEFNTTPSRKMEIHNGWITIGGSLAIGRQPGITWWRGHTMSSRLEEFGINITRFVPGRSGQGLTDDLVDLANQVKAGGAVGLRHHPGLWYDRRRDDHQMIRRIDGNVWPPFFEMPWTRSGQGQAWDGLSQYDLSRFNPWYFGRLRSFAEECENQALVFLNGMYFQHNILEAGAHWADYPWRTANNINNTGFPEPPPYVRRKRIFMADDFYDTQDPVRANLHRLLIEEHLDQLQDSGNVIHFLGEEYSGPLHFMEFWLDCVGDWTAAQNDTLEMHPVIALSAPKNVQDAILSQPERSRLIDVIDFKYWWISPMGLFAPDGGENLAPRQHERLWKGGRPTDETLAMMATEYRKRFPDKAVICNFDKAGWAYLCAGGSMPALPKGTASEILKSIPDMQPWIADTERNVWGQWGTKDDCGILYSRSPGKIELSLPEGSKNYQIFEVQKSTGRLRPLEIEFYVQENDYLSLNVLNNGSVFFFKAGN